MTLSFAASTHFAGVVKVCLTAKALSIHFSRSSSCAQFDQVQQKRKRDLLHPVVLFHHSTKQAKTLCCEFVNAKYHISTLTADPARLHLF
jgi:hypothetical protein